MTNFIGQAGGCAFLDNIDWTGKDILNGLVQRETILRVAGGTGIVVVESVRADLLEHLLEHLDP
ncbi:hypothetical protein LCGC14_0909290 [marine sediment metagenome]|uniref:Uncharacterized protein n=1 Tax=marine sediment metagenome TaxID=412755 RepID=A0A0F9PEU8_9ZZZZ